MSAAHALATARAAGVHIEVVGENLRVRAPKDPGADVLSLIRQNKPELVALLRTPAAAETPAVQSEVEDLSDFPDMPEFLDRVKHPQPGDEPPYGFAKTYPSGGLIKK